MNVNLSPLQRSNSFRPLPHPEQFHHVRNDGHERYDPLTVGYNWKFLINPGLQILRICLIPDHSKNLVYILGVS